MYIHAVSRHSCIMIGLLCSEAQVTDEIHALLYGKGKIRALPLQGLTDVAQQQTMRRRDNHAMQALTSCQFVLKALHETCSLPELSHSQLATGRSAPVCLPARVLSAFNS